MEGTEKFCLRWNDFESNISEGFRELREEKDFFDVTLACDDSQIQAHKVVISACSPFFRNVLRRNPHQHPLLYLKGVKYKELLSILNFMYMGEVNIAQEELNSFLAVAEDLRVKGLTQNNADTTESKTTAKPERSKQVNQPTVSQERAILAPSKRPRASHPSTAPLSNVTNPQQESEDEIQEVAAVKTETFEPKAQQTIFHQPVQDQLCTKYNNSNSVALDESYTVDETFEFNYGDTSAYDDSLAGMNVDMTGTEANTDPIAAREEEIMSLILKDVERKLFTCALCKFGASSRHKAFCHIESKHFQDSPVTYTCPFCGKTAQTKNAIGLHISRNHKHERGDSKNSLFPKETLPNSFY
eukprot:GFUD01034768.1.p1 GENE.GFUD01034768.1~~GFUD01034768.1.p1  ORF type:complete len:357 (-),score=74.77 GFUD01034768.1:161-1231(-)